MKKILFLFLTLILFTSFGVAQEIKKIDEGKLNFPIYNILSRRGQLQTDMLIYNDRKMSGNPVLKIDALGISNLMSGANYNFNDFVLPGKNNSLKINSMPFDFIKGTNLFFFVEVLSVENNVASIFYNNGEMFFKLDEKKLFLNSEFPSETQWPTVKDVALVKKELELILRNDPAFSLLVNGVNRCVSSRDWKCFKSFVKDSNLERDLAEWGAVSKRKSCEDLSDDISRPEVKQNSFNEEIIPWDFFERIFKFSDSKLTAELRSIRWGMNKEFTLSLRGQCLCDLCISANYMLIKTNSTWNLTFLNLIKED